MREAATLPDADASPRRRVREGVRAMTPFLVSGMPMGLIGGAYGVTSGLGAAKTLLLALAVNSGTVQFIGIQLLRDGAAATAILMTAAILSLRLVFYSVILRPRMRRLGRAWRVLLAFGLVDAVFFTVDKRFKDADDDRNWHWFYLGASAAMYTTWMVATVVGVVIGAEVTRFVGGNVDFPLTALFAAMLGSTLVGWKPCVAAAVAAAVAVGGRGLPLNLGLIAATVGGALVALACDRVTRKEAMS